MTTTAAWQGTGRKVIFPLLAIMMLIFLVGRWFFLINFYSVNILYWDQWDFLEGLFDDHSLWELFTWQHGPHRQGIGFLLIKIVADLSSWDTRAESFVIGILVCLAALTALLTKYLATRRITPLDTGIAILYLTPLQLGLFANTPNISHGSMPLLLMSLFALCWLIQNRLARYTLCSILNFLTIYTGFGLFWGLVTPFLFLSEMLLAFQSKDRNKLLLAQIFFFLSVGAFLSFFLIGYTFNSAAPGFLFPHPYPLAYLKYICITLSHFIGIRGSFTTAYLTGPLIGLSLFLIMLRAGSETVRPSAQTDTTSLAVAQITTALIAFTLLFCANLAVGRICLGLESAGSSRYFTYLIPGFFAMYLFAVSRLAIPRTWFMVIFSCLFITTFSPGQNATRYFQQMKAGKLQWKQNYLKTGNIWQADRLSGFKIHPNPPHTHLRKKLDYLKTHRLNLFKQTAK